MRRIITFAIVILLAQPGHSQEIKKDSPAVTAAPVQNKKPDSPATVKKDSLPANTAAASPKVNADSLSNLNDLNQEKAHMAEVYANAKGKSYAWPFFITAIVLLALGLWLLFNTSLCKDLSYEPETNVVKAVDKRKFSYAKVQLFWWTLIILICFISFFFYTGVLIVLNSTVILLLGGGLAVSIFGNVIDKTQMQQNTVPIRHQDLDEKQGLFVDILSDEGGISIHRFQAVIFNIIFGIGFIHSFYLFSAAKQVYPFLEFENWQLTLLGISAGSYLGFKANENSTATKSQREMQAVLNTKNSGDVTGVQDTNTPITKGLLSINTTVAGPAPKFSFQTQAFQNLKSKVLKNTVATPGASNDDDTQ